MAFRGNLHSTPDWRSFGDRLRTWLTAAAAVLVCVLAFGASPLKAEVRALKLYNLHTNERATIVFKRDGAYDQAGLKQLNQFLRDWREDRVIDMDPHLFDLVWEVYQQTGSGDYINVVCGYRSPPTNEMLRRRSSGVAQNSLHMKGEALDFFIPGVDLAKLRVIGLRMQAGGVGFYPTSGSPFVHIDTGSVRHWPRMTHDQLVKVFPDGKTLYIPSDGKPLPGYSQALAAYKARQANGGEIAVASLTPPRPKVAPTLAAYSGSSQDPDEVADNETAAESLPQKQAVGVAVASYITTPVPLPRLAPSARPTTIADLIPPMPQPSPRLVAALDRIQATPSRPAPDFGSRWDWIAPPVPASLATAMAQLDRRSAGASLPIAPTAVVATVTVSRPLQVEAITSAVLRTGSTSSEPPQVLAYANDTMPAKPARPVTASVVSAPLSLIPFVNAATKPAPQAPATPRATPPALTMTALDTHGLRLWMTPTSTRQKTYALFTMPDFDQSPALMTQATAYSGRADAAYAPGLRTDSFSGAAR